MEYFSVIKRKTFDLVIVSWMNLELVNRVN